MTTVLSAEELWAGYGNSMVLRGLNFTVRSGEVLTVLGSNGAGKTTALLTLVGLLKAHRGSVRLTGEPVDSKAPFRQARRGMRLVPDDRGIFPGLTGREHFRLCVSKRDSAREREILVRFPALEPILDREAGLMSGGEQQMLAVACALMPRPKLLLIDELSLGLAPKIVHDLLPAVASFARDEGAGVIVVEQHADLALRHADHALLLRRGEQHALVTAQEALRNPDLVANAYFGESA